MSLINVKLVVYVKGTVPQQTYLGDRLNTNNKSLYVNITKWKQFNKQITTDTRAKQSTLNLSQITEQASMNCYMR